MDQSNISNEFLYVLSTISRQLSTQWRKEVTLVFGIIVCTTLNKDQRMERRDFSEEIRKKKKTDQHVKSKAYRASSSKQLPAPVITVAIIFRKFKAHESIANLPECGQTRKINHRLNRRILWMAEKTSQQKYPEKQAELQGQAISVSDRTISNLWATMSSKERTQLKNKVKKKKPTKIC